MTVTAVSSLPGSAKLNMDDIRDLILSEDIRRKESGESLGSALSTQSRGKSQHKGNNQNHGRSKSKVKDQKKDRKDIVY